MTYNMSLATDTKITIDQKYLDSLWKRPPDVAFPTIWHRFERKTHDGKSRKFFIQDVTEDMQCFINDFMCNGFLADEPMCKSIEYVNDPAGVDNTRQWWRVVLNQKVSLACFEEDPNNTGKAINFCAANCLFVHQTGEEDFQFKAESSKILYGALRLLSDLSLEIRRDHCFIDGYGLSVSKQFEGMNIAYEMLLARQKLCKAIGVPVSRTIFTNIKSQKAAAKAGFKNVMEISYVDLKKENSAFQFDKTPTESVMVMYWDGNEETNGKKSD